ncbi:MAG: cell division protein FtsZ [Candidatus Eisenbacteria bacterium]
MLEMVENRTSPAVLKVFGVGGGGSNAVNRMISARLNGVEFWIANTDQQALAHAPCPNRMQIGTNVTRGRGAGGDPEVGRLSAEEDAERIQEIVFGADMLFITAGMGGGTGTGAAPVIARLARELGILTVAIVTKPFAFEGKKKLKRAMDGLDALREHVDTLIAIPNQKLMHIVPPGTSFESALLLADEVLFQATRGISDLIIGHGIINLDFADVRTVMRNRGNALLGCGSATGDDRAVEAAAAAVSSPLLEELSITGAEALLVNVQGGAGMSFHEAAEAAQYISDRAGEEADVFWGAVVDPELGDEMRVTIIATGFTPNAVPAPEPTFRVNRSAMWNGAEQGERGYAERPASPLPTPERAPLERIPAPNEYVREEADYARRGERPADYDAGVSYTQNITRAEESPSRDTLSRDALPRDAGSRDAGSRDAGPRDAGSRDGARAFSPEAIESDLFLPSNGSEDAGDRGAERERYAEVERRPAAVYRLRPEPARGDRRAWSRDEAVEARGGQRDPLDVPTFLRKRMD